jgi:hypothetical protein
MPNEIHVDDIGTKFMITIKDGDDVVDISSALFVTLIFRKPDDEVIYRDASFSSDGTDGQVYYDIVDGDFDEAGYYKIQAKVTFPSGVFYTNIHTFQVHCNL